MVSNTRIDKLTPHEEVLPGRPDGSPMFRMGRVVATPGALQHLKRHGVHPFALLKRHVCGDWGAVHSEDARANATAVDHRLRILSSYEVGAGKVWIITEGDRSATTILLPEEY
jgi:hypothetical protein